MKRILALLLTLLLLMSPALADEAIDLTKMTPAELEALIAAAQLELTMQEDRLIERSVELLKDYYKAEYAEINEYGYVDNPVEGYLEIIHTQVVYLKDEIVVEEKYANAAMLFDNVAAIVEFIVLDDWYGTNSYYMPSFGVMSVLQYRDGTLEVRQGSQIDRYRSRTYTTDFTPIIASISDRNYEFNNTWYLLK